jgi:hypothetical protein
MFHITSFNIATWVGTGGKLQFVDMAASDIVHGVKKMGDAITTNEEYIHFCNKSIDALNDVGSKCEMSIRSFRTLSNILEADAKVSLLCCVSSVASDLFDNISTLRFGIEVECKKFLLARHVQCGLIHVLCMEVHHSWR